MNDLILDRISIDTDICGGKPTIRGMRITVETILGYLAAGDSVKDILSAYSFLQKEDIQACMAFAVRKMYYEKTELLSSQ